MEKSETIFWTSVETPLGISLIAESNLGILATSLPKEKPEPIEKFLPKIGNFKLKNEITPLLGEAKNQLLEYFSGSRSTFQLPLDLRGTPFQIKVWNRLQKIPYGFTCSYQDIANSIQNSKGVRAVGLANGRNPIPMIIPCHRVIGKNGSLTGFGGGIPLKEKLLKLEADNFQKHLNSFSSPNPRAEIFSFKPIAS